MSLREKHHEVDFCVVGGGMSGLCAAVTAARHGARVALIQDRPVLGGNASSEIRMWVCGAHGPDNKETGLLEEIHLENLYRNFPPSYSIWDSVLYGLARYQPNLTLLLNSSVTEAAMEAGAAGRRIASVKAWQLTTQTWHTVKARLFADCSGDGILGPLTGAEFRIGREAASEFNEDIEPPVADCKTMGLSCLIEARETDRPQPFIPPVWANRYETDAALANRDHRLGTNFWWMELGGEQDSIHDTEDLRDALLKIAFGVWDHIKNHGDHGAENWMLEWVGFLPGKRESRRFMGDHVITQNDVRAGGRFDDLVAYGGWSMDDHHPAGFRHPGQPTIFHPAPSPYGIPYRALYSRNVGNLFFAGRNISGTHAAMSSTRVMATCSLMGQAVGTAAALATAHATTPRGVYRDHLKALQQALMDDDCWLPGFAREVAALSRQARLTASAGDPEALRNGIDRAQAKTDNGWSGTPDAAWVEYAFEGVRRVTSARFTFDSDLNHRLLNMPCRFDLHPQERGVPKTVIRAFRLEACTADGQWREVARVDNNYQRLVRVPLNVEARAVRFVPESTWGAELAHLFAFEVA